MSAILTVGEPTKPCVYHFQTHKKPSLINTRAMIRDYICKDFKEKKK